MRHLRFGTKMGASYVDGRPSFILKYADFKNGSGDHDPTDEIRKLSEGIYLCAATTRAEDGGRSALWKPSRMKWRP